MKKMFALTFISHKVWKSQKSLIQYCEQSYVYILSGQKIIKYAKNGQFDDF